VKTLAAQNYVMGRHKIIWNGLKDNGTHSGFGVYLLRLHADTRVSLKKVIMLK